MLVDHTTITVVSGKGGNGAVTFYPGKKGPSGGDGGNGGDVFVVADRHVSDLRNLSNGKVYKAQDGINGMNFTKHGKNGETYEIRVPLHTTISFSDDRPNVELTEHDERILVAKGGRGGRGNVHFATATHQVPKTAEKGLRGKTIELNLEMKLIADIGLVGLPNAGKSTLLNALTSAKSQVASYPFTTLEPHLGVFQKHVIADIPGLIEGASGGKGLGHKFLKHIEKVKTIFHLISSESEDLEKDYKTIRKEIEDYSSTLSQMKEVILLTKTDLIEENEILEKVNILAKLNKKIMPISVIDDEQMNEIKKLILHC